MHLRVATYNILNTKDRYTEREALMKQNLYAFSADIIGIQEVVFGDTQLSELTQADGPRHIISDAKVPLYKSYQAQVQNQIFSFLGHPDPNAKIDGNAVLLSNDLAFEVKDHRILHLSAVRNCQLVKLVGREDPSKIFFLVNTHLHHPMDDDLIRQHQAESMLIWIKKQPDYDQNQTLVIITGDFNAKPDSKTYQTFLDFGYVSCHQQVFGQEPERTFPTGIQAQFMDLDPPGTFDYIFVKGSCKIVSCEVAAANPHPDDHTIYGSDHMAIVADLII